MSVDGAEAAIANLCKDFWVEEIDSGLVGWLASVSCSKQLLRPKQLNNNNIKKIV